MLRRWLMFGLALLLLTLCLAAWGVSYWRQLYAFHNGKTYLSFTLSSARVLIRWGSKLDLGPGWHFYTQEVESWDDLDQRATFCWLGFSYGPGFDFPYFTIPLWFPSLLSLLLVWFTWRKSRRKPEGKAFPIEPSVETKSPSA